MKAMTTLGKSKMLIFEVSLAFLAIVQATNEESTTSPCPEDFIHYPDEARCYLVVSGNINELDYYQARDYCEGKDAALASLETADEIDFVGSHVLVFGTNYLTSGKKQNGTYYWNTGEPIPDDNPKWSYWYRPNRECVAIRTSDFVDVTVLETMRCFFKRPFICERGLAGVTDCSSAPCLNEGTCQDSESGPVCLCSSGFTGQNCETDVNECLSWPCQNGGSCINGRGRYSCACPEGFVGHLCQFVIGECNDNLCQHGAVCENQSEGYTCSCTTGYTGTFCELDADAPCPEGFYYYEIGDRCYYVEELFPLNIDGASEVCDSLHARLAHLDNPGKLQFVGSLFRRPGFHIVGARRENDNKLYWMRGSLLPNTSSHWQRNQPIYDRDCVAVIRGEADTTELLTMRCYYERPYVCERATRMTTSGESCASDPCFHGGTCVQQNGGAYVCRCVNGFSGHRCEFDYNECRRDPCKNRGICTQHRGFYKCRCQRGYTGANCTINLLESCPAGFIQRPGTARCYYVESTWEDRRGWVDATEFCQSMGASLADLTTEEERQYVASILIMKSTPNMVGARRATDGSLYWGNGEPLAMSRVESWRYGFSPAKDCIGIVLHNVVKLMPIQCERVRPFVCERDTL